MDLSPEIIRAAQKGDPDAFEAIVVHYQKVTMSVAYYITGSRDDAEELCQEAFLRFYKYMNSFLPHRGSLKSYLYKTVANLSYAHLSKQRGRADLESSLEVLPPELLSEGPPVHLESAEIVTKLLEHLTARERSVFVMREVGEMEYPEIAAALNISPVTARRFYSLARQKLRALIEQHHPEYMEKP
jgi:RNA polymerase sigma-70 factor (ECF subfamily)